MRITCPSCSTSYTIAGDKIGAKGRSVRCASCGNKWHVAPDSEAADASDDTGTRAARVAQPEAAVESPTFDVGFDSMDEAGEDTSRAELLDETASVADVEEPQSGIGGWDKPAEEIDLDAQLAAINKSKDIESFAKKPKIKVSKKKPVRVRKPFKFDMERFLVRARPVFGGLVLVMSLGVIGLGVVLRTPIVAAFPGLASLYAAAGLPVNLRGINIGNLKMLREVENAQPVLVVEGELTNPGTSDRSVPAIRFALRGDDAQEIYAWSIEPKTVVLTPGATMRFRTRLASPPEQAADIQVRMIDRRNRQAALND